MRIVQFISEDDARRVLFNQFLCESGFAFFTVHYIAATELTLGDIAGLNLATNLCEYIRSRDLKAFQLIVVYLKQAQWQLTRAFAQTGLVETLFDVLADTDEEVVISALECVIELFEDPDKHAIEELKDVIERVNGMDILDRLWFGEHDVINIKITKIQSKYPTGIFDLEASIEPDSAELALSPKLGCDCFILNVANNSIDWYNQ